jgi:hypothetical protein
MSFRLNQLIFAPKPIPYKPQYASIWSPYHTSRVQQTYYGFQLLFVALEMHSIGQWMKVGLSSSNTLTKQSLEVHAIGQ